MEFAENEVTLHVPNPTDSMSGWVILPDITPCKVSKCVDHCLDVLCVLLNVLRFYLISVLFIADLEEGSGLSTFAFPDTRSDTRLPPQVAAHPGTFTTCTTPNLSVQPIS